jgi:GEVED domain
MKMRHNYSPLVNQEFKNLIIPSSSHKEQHFFYDKRQKLYKATASINKFLYSLLFLTCLVVVKPQPLKAQDISWTSYMDLGSATFDQYSHAVASNNNGTYQGGITSRSVSPIAYLGGAAAAGFIPSFIADYSMIVRYAPDGGSITAYTGTGIIKGTSEISDIELFPDGKVLVLFENGVVQIYSADLKTQYYNANPLIAGVSATSVAIKDNSTFYVAYVLDANINVPGTLTMGPDAVRAPIAGLSDGLIVCHSFNGTSSVTPLWGTFVGGDGSAKGINSVALTTDKTKLCFAFNSSTSGTTGMHALVNAVDATALVAELIIGVLPATTTVPTNFDVLSWLGGTLDESTGLVAATNTNFYVSGTTQSTNLPAVTGAPQTTFGGGLYDAFLSVIPLNGSSGSGFRTTYIGGTNTEAAQGLAVNQVTGTVAVMGKTLSTNFPVNNSTPPANIYKSGSSGGNLLSHEIFYTLYSPDLATRKFATYIGGSNDDYLNGLGSGSLYYSSETGTFTLNFVTHSTLTYLNTYPGYDKSKTNAALDTWYVMAFSSEPSAEYGDAPLSYEGSPTDLAYSLVPSTVNVRLGATIDKEVPPVISNTTATTDDITNSGSADDEDGVSTFPALAANATAYSLSVSVFNNTGAATTLQGWIDFNLNGTFDNNEYATVSVPANASQQTVTLAWSGLTGGVAGNSFVRLRLNDDATKAATDDIGFKGNGEVEDYALTIDAAAATTAPPTGMNATPTPTCVGTSVALSATGISGATYTWSVSPAGATLASAAGTVSGTTASNTLSSTAAGTYTVSVTQTVAGVTSSATTTTVTVNGLATAPVPTASTKTNVCPANTVDLTTLEPAAVAGQSYEWHTVSSNPTSGVDLVTTPATASAGTYYLYTKSTAGACYSPASSAVTATVTTCCPTITNIAGNNTNPATCSGSDGSIKVCGLTANGTGYTINYDKNGTAVTALTSQTADASGCITITGLTAGSYTNIKVSNTACPSGSNALSATLADPSGLSSPSALAGIPNPACTGSAVALTATGTAGATYIWSVSPAGATLASTAGTVSGTTASNSLSSTAAGTYTVSVTQTVAGCTSVAATTSITVNGLATAPVPTASTKSNVCPVTTVDLTSLQPAAVAGQIYEWHTVASNPTSGVDLVTTPATASAGTYYLYTKSTAGACYSTASSAVTATISSCCNVGSVAPDLMKN